MADDVLCEFGLPVRRRGLKDVSNIVRGSVPRINQRGLCGTPSLLKRYEALLVGIRASKVEPIQTQILGLPDRLPQEQVHTSKIVESKVTAPVLVHHRVLVTYCDHRRHRPIALRRYPN